MSETPSIRNSWTKAALRRTRSFPPEAKARFAAHMDDDIAEQIRKLGNADWISLDDTLVVLDALHAAFDDDEGFVEFWRDLIYDSYAGGLFSQLIARAATLGGDTKRLLRLAPQAWAISTRKCGVVDVSVDDDGSLRLKSMGFPVNVMESRPFALLFRGALMGMLGFVGGTGEIGFRRIDRDDGTVEALEFQVS